MYLRDKYAKGGARDGVGQEQKPQPSRAEKGKEARGEGDRADKNWISKAALARIGDENKMIDPIAYSARRDKEFAAKPRRDKRNRMILNYTTQDGSRVILNGINENKDSIYVVLDRVKRPYVLAKSTLNAGKYD